MIIKEFAPAKLNLTLHVMGLRDDGYHLLDSLVAFADIGDVIEVAKAATTTLDVVGPRAAGIPTDASNLALRAAALFPVACTTKITLHKHLPVAAGIGGGSADAAAVLRAMCQLWDLPVPNLQDQLTLGADVPVCMDTKPKFMRGIGDDLSGVRQLPELGVVLVNANEPVATGPVFKNLKCKTNAPMSDMPMAGTALNFAAWLGDQRNDLEQPAIAHCPVISDVLRRLSDLNPLLTRMSGSGGTCFALFDNPSIAAMMAKRLQVSETQWWVESGRLLTA